MYDGLALPDVDVVLWTEAICRHTKEKAALDRVKMI